MQRQNGDPGFAEAAAAEPQPHDHEEDNDDSQASQGGGSGEEEDDLPSDVEAALLLLRRTLYSRGAPPGGAPPIILKSMLYTVLPDRTAVDRDIDELRLAGKVRLFKLATCELLWCGVCFRAPRRRRRAITDA